MPGLAVDADLRNEFPPEDVDYIVYAPNGPVSDFTPFTRLKAVLSLWAGVEKIVPVVPAELPLTRMVDSGLERGMTEWVVGHTLRYHLGMDAHILGQNGHWEPKAPPLAKDRHVTVLGLGALGTASAQALAALGFQVSGWSRTPERRLLALISHYGADGLKAALAQAEIVILLLPDTPATENTLNADTLALLPNGCQDHQPGPRAAD